MPLLLLGGLLLVAGCDSSVDLQQDDADPTARTVPDDSSGLALAPMPTGSELLTPGDPAPKNNADASAYGCYLASRPYSDEVAFHSRYLHFPEEVVAEAGNDTRRVIWSVAARTETAPALTGVRYMHCILPDTDAAEQLAREQILETGLEAAAYKAIQDEEGVASKSGGCTTITVREVLFCVGPVDGPFHTCDYIEYDITVCEDDSDEGSSSFPDGDDGGASGGGNENGDDGQGCNTGDGPATSPVESTPPGSDCEPVDPCESDNPPADCDDEEDDATPCSEVEFDNDTHAEIMETLDELGILESLKDESNFGANQGDRLENGRWIVRNEDSTIETEPFDQTADSPITLGNPGPPPANAIGSIHTHPFSDGEVFTDHDLVDEAVTDEVLEDYGVDNLANPDSFPNIIYDSKPSPGDYQFSSSFLELDYTNESHHFVIDESGVIEYQGEDTTGDGNVDNEGSAEFERCGF